MNNQDLNLLKKVQSSLKEIGEGSVLSTEKAYEQALRRGDMEKAKALHHYLSIRWDNIRRKA